MIQTDKTAGTEATIQATIERYFAATRSSNPVEGMVACFAEDCIHQDPVDGPVAVGPAQVRQALQPLVALFISVGLTVDFVAINGQEAAVKWSGHGVGHNGREVTFAGIDLFEFNSQGQIQSLRAYWNPGPILATLQES